jgi:agmatinase
MPLPLLEPVSEGAPTFLGAPRGSLESLTTPFGAMGAPFGVPYTIRNVHHGASEAPGALGAASARFGRMLKHDFDLGGTRSDGHPWPIVDLGDGPADHGICRATLHASWRPWHAVVARGTAPVVLGADDSVSALAIRGLERAGPLTVVRSMPTSTSATRSAACMTATPVRCAARPRCPGSSASCMLVRAGSARPRDVQDTLAAGNVIMTAREVREKGVSQVLDLLQRRDATTSSSTATVGPFGRAGHERPLPWGTIVSRGSGPVRRASRARPGGRHERGRALSVARRQRHHQPGDSAPHRDLERQS